jgi:hypothetical protein
VSDLVTKIEVKLHLSQTAIDELVKDIQRIIEITSNKKINEIRTEIQKNVDLDTYDRVKIFIINTPAIIESSLASKGELSTEFKRTSFLTTNFSSTYIKPIEYSVDTIDGKREKFIYMPLLKVIGALLTHDEILSDVKTNQKHVNYRASFDDGKHFKDSALFSTEDIVLKFNFYLDEVQFTDPIGIYRN